MPQEVAIFALHCTHCVQILRPIAMPLSHRMAVAIVGR
jgi:hypothetical protein